VSFIGKHFFQFLAELLGVGEFLPDDGLVDFMTKWFCQPEDLLQGICSRKDEKQLGHSHIALEFEKAN
jgi:hypothetical protein